MVYRYGEKLKRNRRNLKKYVIGTVATILVAGGMALPALATGPSNFPATCDAGHGAPGGLGAHSPYAGGVQGEGGDNNTLPNGTTAPSAGSQFGMEQGADTTGQNNSGLSAICRSL